MKIAIATRRFAAIARHAGQTREWLLYECEPSAALPDPARITLTKAQLPHHFQDDGPHPLDGVDYIVSGSAGEGFVRRMARRGAKVMITGERNPRMAAEKLVANEPLAPPGVNPLAFLCKIHDLFSKH
jgi:hypothetical protein